MSLSRSQGSNILLFPKAQAMLLANVLPFIFAHRPKLLGLGDGGAAVTWVRLSSASYPSLSLQARGQEHPCISPSLWAASTPSFLSSWSTQPLHLPTQLIRPSCGGVYRLCLLFYSCLVFLILGCAGSTCVASNKQDVRAF